MTVFVPTLPDEVRTQAKTLLERGEYRRAAEQCDAHLASLPEPAGLEACLDLARLWLESAEPHLALRYADSAVARGPADARALAVRVECLTGGHRTYEAIAAARQAVERCPDDPALWLALAGRLSEAKLRKEALEAADRGLAHSPGHTELRFARGNALLGLHRHAEAEAEFEHLDACRVAGLHRAHGRYAEAIAHLDEHDPAHLETLLGCLIDAKRRAEAGDAARTAAARWPDDPDVHLVLAGFHHEQDRPHEALQAADRAVELRPGDRAARLRRVTSLFGLDLDHDARAACEDLMRSPDPDEQLEVVTLCHTGGRLHDALRYVDSLLELHPWHREALRSRPAIFDALGNHRAAESAARQAVGRRPQDSVMHGDLATWYGAFGERGWLRRLTGFRLVRRALRVDPGDPDRQAEHIQALCELGRLRRAESAAAEQLACHPDAFAWLCDIAKEHAIRGAHGRAMRIFGRLPPRRDLALRTAEILIELGAFPQAHAAVAALVESSDGDPQTPADIAELFYFTAHADHALPYLDRAVEMAPGFVAALARRTDCYNYMDRYAESAQAARDALTVAPDDPGLWGRLVAVTLLGYEAEAAEEVVAAIPEARRAVALEALADVLYERYMPEEAVAFRARSIHLAPRADLVVTQASALRELGWYGAALRLLRAHTSLVEAARDLNRDLGLHALVTDGYGELDRVHDRRRWFASWWRSGGPFAALRNARRAHELAVLSRWEVWSHNLFQLESLDGLGEPETEAVRAENETFVLAWTRLSISAEAAVSFATEFGAVTGIWVSELAAIMTRAWIWPDGEILAITGCVAPAVLAIAPLSGRIGQLLDPPLRSAALSAGLLASGGLVLWARLPGAGIFLGTLGLMVGLRAACGWAAPIPFSLKLRLVRRRQARASILNDLLELLMLIRRGRHRNTIDDRTHWAYLLERAAGQLTDALPRRLEAGDAAIRRWVETNARAAACALRRLKRQALAPGEDSLDLLSAEVHRAASAVASGNFARLRLVREPEKPRRGWLHYAKLIARTVVVMGLPVLGVLAFKTLLGAGYQTALLASAVWAGLYLLLALDPGLRDKIDTARSLLSASSAVGKPESPRPDRQP
ncbi:hypothetical protein ACIBHX_27485 [Nonomuraea sp. NPDC050536]|uniref:hypothetical protein n=1 Tax=Nonomuraea sp. NPDC050536 TaxID=3364366 RepID=UPI0037C965D1